MPEPPARTALPSALTALWLGTGCPAGPTSQPPLCTRSGQATECAPAAGDAVMCALSGLSLLGSSFLCGTQRSLSPNCHHTRKDSTLRDARSPGPRASVWLGAPAAQTSGPPCGRNKLQWFVNHFIVGAPCSCGLAYPSGVRVGKEASCSVYEPPHPTGPAAPTIPQGKPRPGKICPKPPLLTPARIRWPQPQGTSDSLSRLLSTHRKGTALGYKGPREQKEAGETLRGSGPPH